jgi:YbbR domain-containing protein
MKSKLGTPESVATGGARLVEIVVAAATENWGTKILAFMLALVLFIGTRDEVTRSFTIPLRVIEDPDRVLLTEPPATVEVRLRGPWANVNRIAEDSLGAATLDLREVRPGPMALDPASVVMPPKVVLDQLQYDPVDLRFEAVIERGFAIRPVVVGSVDPDYELVSVRVEPDSWPVRGPSSAIARLEGLGTEVLDLDGARADVEQRVELTALPEELAYLRVASGERPEVRFVAELTPILDEIELVIATDAVLREALPADARIDEAELPASERVAIRGPKLVLRELAALDEPVVAVVEVEKRTGRAGALPITLRFEWSAKVAEADRAQLSIVPPLIRLRLAADADRP